jgi:flagellin
MQINNNLSAIFVNRQVKDTMTRLNSVTEKLATGLRINRAGDDATNLAVSERMRTQVRGLRQAEQNALNGLSFIQVAESGLGQVNDILQRIRSLSVQAANGIYSETDRGQIALEISQLIEEVDRISTTAEFNGRKILTGELASNSKKASMFFHVGPNENQRIRAYIATMNAKAFGLVENSRAKTISTVGKANAMIGQADAAIDKLNRQRADLGAYYNRMEITINALRGGYEAMTAADSRLRDVDMAEAVTEFTRQQILLQSSTAMLAQANFSSQLVVQLLDRM